MAKWASETTMKFVQEYKTHECLWNFKLPEYKERAKRDAAYHRLVQVMRLDNFGVAEVKSKIKNLRSTYNQEMKKITESKMRSNTVYVSNVKWLRELEPTMNIGEKKRQDENINEEQEFPIDEKDIKNEYSTQLYPEAGSSCRPRHKAQSFASAVKELRQLQETVNKSRAADDAEDSYDAFGKSVAMQLRKMAEERALVAQSAIQNLLTDYGVQDVRERDKTSQSTFGDHHLSVGSPTTSYYESSPSLCDNPLGSPKLLQDSLQ